MLAAEEMYDVLVTTFNTKSEVNIWRQTSNDNKFLVVQQYLRMILAMPQRCTTVQCGLFWRGDNMYSNDLCNQWCISLKM
jgi:hypothetical protein